jgi:hypothetical protein
MRERRGSIIHMITGLVIENRARCPIVQSLVRTLVIVKCEPFADAKTCFGYRVIRVDEHLLVFQAVPQPFDENATDPAKTSRVLAIMLADEY